MRGARAGQGPPPSGGGGPLVLPPPLSCPHGRPFARACAQARKESLFPKAPLYVFGLVALSNTVSTTCQYEVSLRPHTRRVRAITSSAAHEGHRGERAAPQRTPMRRPLLLQALRYVSFSVATITKCAKGMPVILWVCEHPKHPPIALRMARRRRALGRVDRPLIRTPCAMPAQGTLVLKKRHVVSDYAVAVAVILGCILFLASGDVAARRRALPARFVAHQPLLPRVSAAARSFAPSVQRALRPHVMKQAQHLRTFCPPAGPHVRR